MGLFYNRPFALAMACFLGVGSLSAALLLRGGVHGMALSVAASIAVLLALGIVTAVLFLRRDRVRAVCAMLALFFVVIGSLRVGLFFSERYAKAQNAIGERVVCSVRILERDFLMPGYSRYLVDAKSDESCSKMSNLLPNSFRAVLVSAAETHFSVGDTLRTEATVVPLTDFYTDPSASMADGAAVGLLPCTETHADGTREEMLYSIADESEGAGTILSRVLSSAAVLRMRLSFILTETVGGSAGQLAAAVLLGDRSGLDPAVSRDFGRAGIAHLLALSGMHMSILIGGAALILRRLGASRRVCAVLTLLLIPAFLILTGFPMSACRAGLMLATQAVLGLLSRRSDPITSLFLAVSMVVFVFPSAVLSVGLWMSFASVLGILLMVPRLERSLPSVKRHTDSEGFFARMRRLLRGFGTRMLRALVLSLGVSLIASFSILPVLWVSGGEFAIFGMLSNLLTVWLMPIFLFLSLLLLLLWRFAVLLSALTVLIRLIGGYLTSVAGLVSGIPHAAVALRDPFADAAVLAFLIPTVLLCVLPVSVFTRLGRLFGRRKRDRDQAEVRRAPRGLHGAVLLLPVLTAVLIYGIGFALSSAEAQAPGRLTATVVGASEGELIVLGECGRGYLIDTSDGGTSGYREASAAAREIGVTEWETVVIPYFRKDHLTSLPRLCQSAIVRSVLLPIASDEEQEVLFSVLYDRLRRLGVSVRSLTYDAENDFGFGVLTVLSPCLLSRSSYPVYGLSLARNGQRLAYLTSAVNESVLSERADLLAEGSDLLIYGSYGPRRTETYRIPMGRAKTILLSGTENREALPKDALTSVTANAKIDLRMHEAPYRVRIGTE